MPEKYALILFGYDSAARSSRATKRSWIACRRFPAQGHCADGFCIGLRAVPQKPQANIQQVGALLRFLPQDDVTFFYAQHVLGFHTEVTDIRLND